MEGSGPVRTAIVSVGNELLFGETVDTNAAWLGRTLAGLGYSVVAGFTVGDVETDIGRALTQAADLADLVIVTGGLGPTRDDRTREAVTRLAGVGLVEHPGTLAALKGRYEEAGRKEMPPSVADQARIPEGSIPLANPEGTAPGLALDWRGTLLVMLPGVPAELRAIVAGELGSVLDERFAPRCRAHRVHHRVVHTVGIPESTLAERLEGRLSTLEDGTTTGIDIAYLPDRLGVDLRLSLRGGSPESAAIRFDALIAALDDVVRPWRVETTDGDLAGALLEALVGASLTVAVAESCTGGWLGKRLTDRAGASRAFVGGVIVYSNESKTAQLGVPEEDIMREGAVSDVVARRLAEAVAARFGADAGIAVTGVAGPGGGSEEKPVGTVWIATSLSGEVVAVRHRFAGDRAAVRESTTQAALEQLYRRLVEGRPEG